MSLLFFQEHLFQTQEFMLVVVVEHLIRLLLMVLQQEEQVEVVQEVAVDQDVVVQD